MSGIRARVMGGLAIVFSLLACGGTARAHGMGWRADGSFAVVVQFEYGHDNPVAFGVVSVYSPANAEKEYASGKSDANGYFAFRPDAPGVWRVVGDDGQGHAARGEITVTEADLAGTGNALPGTGSPDHRDNVPVVRGGTRGPGWMGILLGLSILLNIALAVSRRQAKAARTAARAAGRGESA